MENWRPVVGYEGLYEVSDLGNVRSLKSGRWRNEQRILIPWKVCGYLRVQLTKDRIRKHIFVHRLVAEAFVPNPNNLETVNHRDEDKTNNSASNLEWMTRADNTAYSQPQLAARQVQQLDKQGNLLAVFPSAKEAQRVTEIAQSSICRCCNGKRKFAGGFKWRFASRP